MPRCERELAQVALLAGAWAAVRRVVGGDRSWPRLGAARGAVKPWSVRTREATRRAGLDGPGARRATPGGQDRSPPARRHRRLPRDLADLLDVVFGEPEIVPRGHGAGNRQSRFEMQHVHSCRQSRWVSLARGAAGRGARCRPPCARTARGTVGRPRARAIARHSSGDRRAQHGRCRPGSCRPVRRRAGSPRAARATRGSSSRAGCRCARRRSRADPPTRS